MHEDKVNDIIDKLDPQKVKCIECGEHFPGKEMITVLWFDGVDRLICQLCYREVVPRKHYDDED